MSIRSAASLKAIDTSALPAHVARAMENPSRLMNPRVIGLLREGLTDDACQSFDRVLASVQGAFALSLHGVFIAMTIVALFAVGISFFIKEFPLSSRDKNGLTGPDGGYR
jgi:hypothetical protein